MFVSGCGVYQSVKDSDSTQGYSVMPLQSPVYWVVPYTEANQRVANPYRDGKASEAKDLKHLWDKTADGKYSTAAARAAADRLFQYSPFRYNESMRSKSALDSYFGRSPDEVKGGCLTYILYTSVLEERHTLCIHSSGIGYEKKSTRRKPSS